MPWRSDAPYLGFSDAKPWLPIGEAHRLLAVDVQEADRDSLLHWTRKVMALRNGSPALRVGTIDFLDVPEDILAFERTQDGEHMLCVFNLGDKPVTWTPQGHWQPVLSTGGVTEWHFPAASGLVAQA